MPDLIVHASVGYLSAKALGAAGPPVVAGTLVPDLLRSVGVVSDRAWSFFGPLHEPVPVVAACLLLSRFFAPAWRGRAFAGLLAGAASHLLLDLCQDHLGKGYFPLYPFSRSSYEWGFLPPEGFFWAGPVLLLFCFFAASERGSIPSFSGLARGGKGEKDL